ncbi:hypothetical protein RHMOL_Rhmol01G0221000 [Rhododendron molle]|uniref:Uncharacterized protein n=1 Tax=Rhododendron molle TaxID=49168 RepID=A0ACC0Q4G6_RHOML|nr:hypothetical protein RHMOL_Rhmol01G0221000 [Rhododendron molle]
MEQTPHLAILPAQGMGHLIPLAEFAKRLLLTHNFSATFITPTDPGPLPAAQKSFLHSLPTGINYLLLPPVNLDDLPDDIRTETRISLTVVRSHPSL